MAAPPTNVDWFAEPANGIYNDPNLCAFMDRVDPPAATLFGNIATLVTQPIMKPSPSKLPVVSPNPPGIGGGAPFPGEEEGPSLAIAHRFGIQAMLNNPHDRLSWSISFGGARVDSTPTS